MQPTASTLFRSALIASIVALVVSGVLAPFALSFADDTPGAPQANVSLGTSFTYQGRLEVDGVPYEGTYDLQFKLFDDEEPGGPDIQIGSTVEVAGVAFSNGVFSAILDFGATAFMGSDRWMEVSISPPAQNLFVMLEPRQRLTATPYALFSLKTGPHDHIGEEWLDARTRTGTFGGNGILNLTNTYVPAFPGQIGGIGIRGSAVTAGIGVYGAVVQGSGPQPGIDANSLIGGVVGIDRTFTCEAVCVGVRGLGSVTVAGFGQSIGVIGSGATIGVSGGSNLGAGVKGSSTSGLGVEAISVSGTAVHARSTSGLGIDAFSDTNAGISAGSGTGSGVSGFSVVGAGVFGRVTSSSANGAGVQGESIVSGTDSIGVVGIAGALPPVRPATTGVYGYGNGANSTGVYGRADGLDSVGIKGVANSSQEFAGLFQGKVQVNGSLIGPSDRRLKHDIAKLPYGLDTILALEPVSFVMNGDESQSTRLGLIAQDVQALIPEIVQADAQSGMLAMSYLELIPVLVNAIKEQDLEIAELRSGPAQAQPSSARAQSAGVEWLQPAALAILGIGLLALAASLWRLGSRRTLA